jgi:hypothetical protein
MQTLVAAQFNNPLFVPAPYFVGWGTLALINAGLAQAKNRSGLAWFLISLLVGPIATLLIVVLDRPRSR